jgi:hypothetical protein
MSCVFQNIDPPPLSAGRVRSPGPAFVGGRGHTRRVERGVGGQYFGRRKTLLCTLPISNPLWSALSIPGGMAQWHNSSADFNPNHNRANSAPKQASLQTTSCPHHHAIRKQNFCILFSRNLGLC